MNSIKQISLYSTGLLISAGSIILFVYVVLNANIQQCGLINYWLGIAGFITALFFFGFILRWTCPDFTNKHHHLYQGVMMLLSVGFGVWAIIGIVWQSKTGTSCLILFPLCIVLEIIGFANGVIIAPYTIYQLLEGKTMEGTVNAITKTMSIINNINQGHPQLLHAPTSVTSSVGQNSPVHRETRIIIQSENYPNNPEVRALTREEARQRGAPVFGSILERTRFMDCKSGLTQEELDFFVKAHKQKKYEENEEKLNCIICTENIEENAEVMTLQCKHTFHTTCITTWLTKQPICPIDRKNLRIMNELM